MRSLGRSDEHAREKRPRLPGRPARRVGPLHAEQRHFSGYSFGVKRVPLRRLFVIAPQGALSSYEDGTCEDKRYSPAVSHSLRSEAKQKSHCPIAQAPAKCTGRPAGRPNRQCCNAQARNPTKPRSGSCGCTGCGPTVHPRPLSTLSVGVWRIYDNCPLL